MPFFSINIAAFNCGPLILDALGSVATQTYGDWEVVVIDDGSTDNTKEVCASQTLIPRDRFVFESQENRGTWEARRRAHALSRGQYVVTLDADDYLCDVHALEKIHREISKSGCDVLLYNATRDLRTHKRFVDYEKVRVRDVANIEPAELLGNMCVSWGLSNIWLKAYKREVMDFGGERIDLIYSEDKLQSFMLLERAGSCRLFDEVLYYYRANPSSITESVFKLRYPKNMLTVESYISAHSKGLQYKKRQRNSYLALHLTRFLQNARKTIGSYAKRKSVYRELREVAVGGNLFTEYNLENSRLDRAIPCILLRHERYRLLDLVVAVRSWGVTVLKRSR